MELKQQLLIALKLQPCVSQRRLINHAMAEPSFETKMAVHFLWYQKLALLSNGPQRQGMGGFNTANRVKRKIN